MNKKDMLESLINHYTDGNKTKFALMIGITPQLVSNWLDRSTFNAETLFSKCEGVSASWLLTGHGEMLHTQNDNTDEINNLKSEIERLKALKTPQGNDKLYELWMRFMANQAQYQDIMKEMAAIYGHSSIKELC